MKFVISSLIKNKKNTAELFNYNMDTDAYL